MEETENEPSLSDVQAELGLGSHHTAKAYVEKAGWTVAVKRLKTLLSPAHMRARVEYVSKSTLRTTFRRPS